MSIAEKIHKTGEHSLMLSTEHGHVEALLTVPSQADLSHMAILGHPHSLQGGTMNNKVVTTLVRTFKTLSIPSLRFNFRGVGKSDGEYDAGIGESEDMLDIVKQCQVLFPDMRFIFAGFSFGSYVAYRAAALYAHDLLITIAPPVHHYDYQAFEKQPVPWIVVQGDDDEVVPLKAVCDFSEALQSPLTLLRFPETGHFFHGKLIELKTTLLDAIHTQGVLA